MDEKVNFIDKSCTHLGAYALDIDQLVTLYYATDYFVDVHYTFNDNSVKAVIAFRSTSRLDYHFELTNMTRKLLKYNGIIAKSCQELHREVKERVERGRRVDGGPIEKMELSSMTGKVNFIFWKAIVKYASTSGLL